MILAALLLHATAVDVRQVATRAWNGTSLEAVINDRVTAPASR